MSYEDDAADEGVLWLGRGNRGDLIIGRDGQCALEPEFWDDGTVRLVDPGRFDAVFHAYVQRHLAEIQGVFQNG